MTFPWALALFAILTMAGFALMVWIDGRKEGRK